MEGRHARGEYPARKGWFLVFRQPSPSRGPCAEVVQANRPGVRTSLGRRVPSPFGNGVPVPAEVLSWLGQICGSCQHGSIGRCGLYRTTERRRPTPQHLVRRLAQLTSGATRFNRVTGRTEPFDPREWADRYARNSCTESHVFQKPLSLEQVIEQLEALPDEAPRPPVSVPDSP